MAASPTTLADDLTTEERTTLYVIAVVAGGRGGIARFAAAQPCIVARVRRLRDRGLVDCEPVVEGARPCGLSARLTPLGSDVVARSLHSAADLPN